MGAGAGVGGGGKAVVLGFDSAAEGAEMARPIGVDRRLVAVEVLVDDLAAPTMGGIDSDSASSDPSPSTSDESD